MKKINIVSGECAAAPVHTLTGEEVISFNEAMMDGPAPRPIFSANFCRLRAAVHHVSPEVYHEKSAALLDILAHPNSWDELSLWFGPDAFCQVNLITLLAALEERGYQGRVTLTLMDDATHAILLPGHTLPLGHYGALYDTVVAAHQPASSGDTVMDHAIALALDYWDSHGRLAELARANCQLPRSELMLLLLNAGRDYGLSDVQAEAIMTHV